MKKFLVLLLVLVVTSCVTTHSSPVTFTKRTITLNLSFFSAKYTKSEFERTFPKERIRQIIRLEPSGLCFVTPYISNDDTILSNNGDCYYFEPLNRWLNYKETLELIDAFKQYAFMTNNI